MIIHFSFNLFNAKVSGLFFQRFHIDEIFRCKFVKECTLYSPMHSVHCTLCMGLASGLGRAASLGVREVNNKSLPDAEWGGLHLASKIKRTEHRAEIVF